ncbi:MAG: 30S ribosomal protein S16 [Prevotella sp.]|nr:30S ribosomal protein S16 [Prevotella sp.]
MATKIRLQRGGHKGYAVYRIVAADARAPRDGRFIEKLGMYNPNTNPATVMLNFDRALYWLEVGAQPTDTVRTILSREGVLMMKHLRGGVKKGAFDEAAAQAKFEAWKADKEKGLDAVRQNEQKTKKDLAAKRLEEEKKLNEVLAKKVAEKKAAAVAEEAEAAAEEASVAAEEAPAVEEAPVAEETPQEAPAADEPAAEEAPAEEA